MYQPNIDLDKVDLRPYAGIGPMFAINGTNFSNSNFSGGFAAKAGLRIVHKHHLYGIGLEYLFTKDGRWGAFFEFRYTYSQVPEIKLNISGIGAVSDKLDTQRFKYTVGFSYHF